jgi:hypothetical protein
MSGGELAHLGMVIDALTLFGLTLAAASAVESRWAKVNGRP